MKEAIGNSFLMMLAMTFLFLIMGLLVGALSYSKAYKAKNKIVNVIEKYDAFDGKAQDEVEADLFKMGYKANFTTTSCKQLENMTLVHDKAYGKYDYCVYEVKTSRGYYYHVITYTHFDIPIIGNYLTFEVRGDSRTVYQGLEG